MVDVLANGNALKLLVAWTAESGGRNAQNPWNPCVFRHPLLQRDPHLDSQFELRPNQHWDWRLDTRRLAILLDAALCCGFGFCSPRIGLYGPQKSGAALYGWVAAVSMLCAPISELFFAGSQPASANHEEAPEVPDATMHVCYSAAEAECRGDRDLDHTQPGSRFASSSPGRSGIM